LVRDSSPRSIRVLPELRATQVEQSFLMSPAQTLYFRTNFDLDGTPVPTSFMKVGLGAAVKFLAHSKSEVLELPEPLWIRFLPINVVLAATWRISGFARLRSRRARTYAIENNDPTVVIFGSSKPPSVVGSLGRLAVGLVFRLLYERVAFGTQGAADAYGRLPFARGIKSTVIPALPSPGVATATAVSESAVFVGRLDERKGVRRLIESWHAIESRSPHAVLTIIGDGPLRPEVQRWANETPASRKYLGSLPHADALIVVSRNRVLVAPSLRDGRWREQVGLPIVEGLSRGLTIVTSDDTGLADWLTVHNHYVYDNLAGVDALANALSQAIESPIDVKVVLDSLPYAHGRLRADAWIHNE